MRHYYITFSIIIALILASIYFLLNVHRPFSKNVSGFALSRDGRQIALLDEEGFELLQIDGNHTILIASAPVSLNQDVITIRPKKIYWAPDGSYVAYQSSKNEMLAYNTRTKMSQVIKGIYSISWSQDSSSIVCIKSTRLHAESSHKLDEFSLPVEYVQVYISKGDLSTRSGKSLFTDNGINRCEWAYNNNYIVYANNIQQHIYIISPLGQIISNLDPLGGTRHTVFDHIYDWKISPDSSNLAISIGSQILIYQLPILNEPVNISVPERALEITWTSDSQKLLYVTINNEKRINDIPIGAPDTSPPHILRSVSAQGLNDHIIISEEKDISQITCDSSNNVYYLSGSNLYKVKSK